MVPFRKYYTKLCLIMFRFNIYIYNVEIHLEGENIQPQQQTNSTPEAMDDVNQR